MILRFISMCSLSAGFLPSGVLLAGVVLLPGKAFSQSVDYRGRLSSRIAIESREGDVQLGELIFEPELTGTLTPNINFTIVGRLRVDTEDRLEPGNPGSQSDIRSNWNRRAYIGDDVDVEIREAYADIYAGEWFLRLGKQQVVWGQSDGLRILDRVNPLSFREFILGDFEDRRIPLWMTNVERTFGPVTVQLLWIPDHTYNEVPRAGVFQVTSPIFVPQIPADFSGPIRITQVERPSRLFVDDDYGVRLTGFANGWDWSLNGLYAYADTQVILRHIENDGAMTISSKYERSLLVGGSASNAFGKVTLRTEIGYETDKYVLTNVANDNDGLAKSAEISGVVGLDYQMDADTIFSGQIFLSALTDNPMGAVRKQTNSSVTFLARRELRNDTVELEGLLIQDINQGDGLLQLSASYELSSAVTLRTGIDLFYGDRSGLYGQFDQADRMTFGVEYGF